jgi:putative addiction module killer protein
MSMRVEEYIRPDGTNPYKVWFDRLDAQAAAKVVTAKLRMELGHTSNIKWFAGLGEYVIDWGPGYRIYLARDGDALIVLFGGGTNWMLKNAFHAFPNVACERRDFRCAPEITHLKTCMISPGHPWPGTGLLKMGHSTARCAGNKRISIGPRRCMRSTRPARARSAQQAAGKAGKRKR